MAMKSILASKIVRAVMQANGKRMIYNNLYPSGLRTVKCYAGADPGKDRAMITQIQEVLDAVSADCFVKLTKARRHAYSGGAGIIVHLG